MTPFIIDLVVTACLAANPNHCSEIRTPTLFVSEHQCQVFSQIALAEVMASHPKRRVARYKCETVEVGEAI
jgi:hypothetical protein